MWRESGLSNDERNEGLPVQMLLQQMLDHHARDKRNKSLNVQRTVQPKLKIVRESTEHFNALCHTYNGNTPFFQNKGLV